VLLKGLETLDLRLQAQCKSARIIAEYLEAHPKISRVLYPHLGVASASRTRPLLR